MQGKEKPEYSYQNQLSDQSAQTDQTNSSRDGRAVASLVLGIVSLVLLPIALITLITAIIGLILSSIVLKENPHDGMAKAGKVMCIIALCIEGFLIVVPFLIFMIPGVIMALFTFISMIFSWS